MEQSDGLKRFLAARRRNPKQKGFFDERAEDWDGMSVHDPSKIEHIVSLLDLRDGMSILDVGTGTGVMVPHYLESMEGGHVTAVDYSERMVAVARRKFPESDRLEYRVQDVYDLDEDGVYDRVVCFSCFPHFPDPVGAIGVLSRALAPGGLLCVAHSSSREHINRVHLEGGDEVSADYLPEAGLMEEMFSSAGLETVFSRDDDEFYIVIGRRSA